MSNTNENTNNNLSSVEKRIHDKQEIENAINKAPKSKLKMRESLSEKEKREKYYSCNSNEVLFFKISKKNFFLNFK